MKKICRRIKWGNVIELVLGLLSGCQLLYYNYLGLRYAFTGIDFDFLTPKSFYIIMICMFLFINAIITLYEGD